MEIFASSKRLSRKRANAYEQVARRNTMASLDILAKLLLLAIFAFWSINAQYSNSYALRWQTPDDCEPIETFNTILLQCVECAEGTIGDATRIGACRCASPLRLAPAAANTSSGNVVAAAAAALRCVECDRGLAVSEDARTCVECADASGRTVAADARGRCPRCAPHTSPLIQRLVAANGTLSERRLCSACGPHEHRENESDDDNEDENSDNDRCEPCRSVKCYCDRVGLLFEKID